MVYRRKGRHSSLPGGFFHLENEKSKTHVTGYGFGDAIQLKDEFGNVWRGMAERKEDAIYYCFRDHRGRVLTGVSNTFVVILRDDQGETWKGFVD